MRHRAATTKTSALARSNPQPQGWEGEERVDTLHLGCGMAQRNRMLEQGGAPALPTGCTYGLPDRAGSAKVKAHGKDGGNVACGSAQVFVALGQCFINGAGAVEHA